MMPLVRRSVCGMFLALAGPERDAVASMGLVDFLQGQGALATHEVEL